MKRGTFAGINTNSINSKDNNRRRRTWYFSCFGRVGENGRKLHRHVIWRTIAKCSYLKTGEGMLQESEWVEVFRRLEPFKPWQKSFILLTCLRQENQYHFSDLFRFPHRIKYFFKCNFKELASFFLSFFLRQFIVNLHALFKASGPKRHFVQDVIWLNSTIPCWRLKPLKNISCSASHTRPGQEPIIRN